uniref:Putative secreted protein n=1 Tax=Panstrongylus lignarius TaxID=156445 RepID=A0A224XS82_9HEMI
MITSVSPIPVLLLKIPTLFCSETRSLCSEKEKKKKSNGFCELNEATILPRHWEWRRPRTRQLTANFMIGKKLGPTHYLQPFTYKK